MPTMSANLEIGFAGLRTDASDWCYADKCDVSEIDRETCAQSDVTYNDDSPGEKMMIPCVGRSSSAPAGAPHCQIQYKNTFLQFFEESDEWCDSNTPRASTTSALDSRKRTFSFHLDFETQIDTAPSGGEGNVAECCEPVHAEDSADMMERWKRLYRDAASPIGDAADAGGEAWAARRWTRLVAKLVARQHADVPLEDGVVTSVGSVCHAEGHVCQPCLFHKKKKGCFDGMWCFYCHFQDGHKVDKKARRRTRAA